MVPSDSADGAAKSFVMLDSAGKTAPSFTIEIPQSGRYALSFRYANGNGPINTNNRCAVRTLFLDGAEVGPMIFPQRGEGQWDNFGVSNVHTMSLSTGVHRVELRLTQHDINMDGSINQAAISSFILARIQ
jgi:hypothetical protein